MRFIRACSLSLVFLVAACGDEPGGENSPDVSNARDVSSDIATFNDAGDDVGTTDVDEDAEDAVQDTVADAADIEDTGGDTPTDTAPDATGDPVGPDGGRILFPGGWLEVPAGALGDLTSIEITENFDLDPDGYDIEGIVWDFGPDGLEFANPFTICFTPDGIRPANMTIRWTRPGSETFESLASWAGDAGAICSTNDHFSSGFVGRLTDEACNGVDCQPAEAACTGDILELSVFGSCVAGDCVFPDSRQLDCAAEGFICSDGACADAPICGDGSINLDEEECDGAAVGAASCSDFGFTTGEVSCADDCTLDSSECSGNLCDDVTCDAPPAAECDGTTALTYETGTCDAGECSYVPAAQECTDTDETCVDGACVRAPRAGELVITEIMANPGGGDSGREWFEIHNLSATPQQLAGLTLSDDGSDSLEIWTTHSIPPGGYAVIGASDSATPTVDVAWSDWGSFSLSNNDDEIELSFGGGFIDAVTWGPGADPAWIRPDGASMSLDTDALDANDNNFSVNWCAGQTEYGPSDDLGSPGEANPTCPVLPFCGDGIVDEDEECDDGNNVDDDGCQGDCTLPECSTGGDCDGPPSDSCSGNTAVTWPETGVCSGGLCEYSSTETNCDDTGQTCVSGACLDAPALEGELVITEIMPNVEGTDTDLEWFEIYNPTGAPIDLDGLTIRDDDLDSFDIVGSYIVPAGSYFVIGESEIAVPGNVDLIWNDFDDGFSLGNTTDEIILEWRGAEIDRIEYNGGWPLSSGVSAGLSAPFLDAEANDLTDNWCEGLEPYGVDPNLGSPGAPNPDCTTPVCGDGEVQGDEECDDGNTTPGDGCDESCVIEPPECALDTDCTAPPANYCSSPLEAVRFGAIGVCEAGECTYPPAPVSCAPGNVCREGDCVVGDTIGPGDLVISEYLNDPDGSDDGLEWFEIYNASGRGLDLDGLTITDLGGETITVSDTTLLPAGSYFVFAESAAAVPVLAFDWAATGSSFTLANSSDEIILNYGRAEIDRIEYAGSWPASTGTAAQLGAGSLDADLNDSSSRWCAALVEYGVDSNTGSPGEPNVFCR